MFRIPSRWHLIASSLILVAVTHRTAAAWQPESSIVIGAALENGAAPSTDPLNTPFGIGFDARGTMYIVELEGGRVHKLDSGGKLTTIAGDGSKGYSGDGGPAKLATFNGMHNVAVTPAGDLYIADSWNHCVRKIAADSGMISTIAGTGQAGFSGDGGPGKKATFDFVMCVSLNPANDKLYVADLRNLRIRTLDLRTGLVRTIAGNGKKGIPEDGGVAIHSPLVDPRAVAVDHEDNVYILERGGHSLRVVTPDGKIRTVAGTGERGAADGPARSAQLNSPKHLAIDAKGNVIIADDVNAKIRLYDPSRQELSTILGGGVTQPPRELSHPHGVYVHQDRTVYVVDTMHHRILRLTR